MLSKDNLSLSLSLSLSQEKGGGIDFFSTENTTKLILSTLVKTMMNKTNNILCKVLRPSGPQKPRNKISVRNLFNAFFFSYRTEIYNHLLSWYPGSYPINSSPSMQCYIRKIRTIPVIDKLISPIVRRKGKSIKRKELVFGYVFFLNQHDQKCIRNHYSWIYICLYILQIHLKKKTRIQQNQLYTMY